MLTRFFKTTFVTVISAFVFFSNAACMERARRVESVAYSLQGMRDSNEDTFCMGVWGWDVMAKMALDLPVAGPTKITKREDFRSTASVNVPFKQLPVVECYAVFDGHGGKAVANYLADKFIKTLKKYLTTLDDDAIDKALKDCFSNLNERIFAKVDCELVGSTALVAIKIGTHVTLALVGDCRAAILCGERVLEQTIDQNLQEEIERNAAVARAKARGVADAEDGIIYYNDAYRVQGRLNLATAFGDKAFADYLTTEPVISHYEITPGDSYLILACDGVWTFLDNKMYINKSIIKTSLHLEDSIWQNTENLCRTIVGMAECSHVCDNLTMITVKLN